MLIVYNPKLLIRKLAKSLEKFLWRISMAYSEYDKYFGMTGS